MFIDILPQKKLKKESMTVNYIKDLFESAKSIELKPMLHVPVVFPMMYSFPVHDFKIGLLMVILS